MKRPHTREYLEVEGPFIEQLQAQGWDYLEGDVDVPYLTERDSFRQVLLTGRLRAALRRINLNDEGQPWLDDADLAGADRVTQAVSRLERLGTPRLMEANQVATRLLIQGVQVPGPDGDRAVTIHYLDFEHPERNDFLAINQFRVDPPWATGNRGYIVPDLVLFVNGIPLVVVEAKRPDSPEPLTEAIHQLLRYANQRLDVEEPEGAERLFRYAQLLVATCSETARLGTVGASHKHYLAWKDTYPVETAEVSKNVGGPDTLSQQDLLIAGALRPERLLDIVHNFTLFDRSGGRLKKIVPRYQQYRAVHKAIHRLQTGATRAEDGKHDRRGGIIWHTQGSGKSLTMVFLIRALRSLPELRRFKVVLITDRTKLEDQLAETAALTGEPLQRAGSITEFLELLRRPGADLVFGMIQKVQDPNSAAAPEAFPLLNDSEEILLLVDEAHRSHTSTLHARLMQGLPNCAQIGFTGTPILEEDKQPTHAIFGRFIDTYTLTESQADRMTVPIRYEGRDVAGEVMEAETLDEVFAQALGDEYSPRELKEIRQNYATHRKVLEAKQLIAAKARDMLRHYVKAAMADGFKAQVVAVSRRAAVRYQKALEEAQRELVAELQAAQERGESTWEQLTIAEILPRLQRIEIAAIISGGNEDPPSWRAWTLQSRQDAYVEDFKRPFGDAQGRPFGGATQGRPFGKSALLLPERGEGHTALLVVCSMLLTGFDAPLERVLYLDKPLYGYELLQAIARVNRTYPGKENGLVVDYFGLADHLHRALEIYTSNHITGGLRPIQDEIPKLRDRHARVVTLFADGGCRLEETETCVELLRDARLRARFTIYLREFLETLNALLHRPEALPYVEDAKQLGLIRLRARNRYRDQRLEIAGAEAKVRQLIDRYVVSQGVNPKIPPLDILEAEFEQHVAGIRSKRAQAAEMEFALRHHIRRHYPEDPVYYQTLSERLEEILQTFAENWEALESALRELIGRHRRTQAETEREDRAVRPFLRLLAEATSDGEKLSAVERRELAVATVELVDRIRDEIDRVDFWRKRVAREQLRAEILHYLDDHDLVPFDQQEALADRLVETAKANHTVLVG